MSQFSDTILRAVILLRLGQGWSLVDCSQVSMQSINGGTVQLLPPANDPRRKMSDKCQWCESMKVSVPNYALEDDPVSSGLLDQLQPSKN